MPDTGKTLRVDPVHPEPVTIQKAGKTLTSNGVVIFPAHSLYGVAANALNPGSVEKVFQIKQRPDHNPILVLIRDLSDLMALVEQVPAQAHCLMDRFWPGGLTLVFKAANHISPRLTANTCKIGIRLPGHPVARALVNAVDFPITGTSANRSGQPGCTCPDQLPQSILTGADLILNAGQVQGGIGSTIVDITCTPPLIIREGTISAAAIADALA